MHTWLGFLLIVLGAGWAIFWTIQAGSGSDSAGGDIASPWILLALAIAGLGLGAAGLGLWLVFN